MICAALAGCGAAVGNEEEGMADAKQQTGQAADPSEAPGAIVIRPERNPDMVYDPETGRVVDTKTGDSFGMRSEMRSGGIVYAGIKRGDGSPGYGYELKGGSVRNPDGTIKKDLWQVFWARRGDWMDRFVPVEMGLGKAHEAAEAEAQNDSLEQLAQFLRAEFEGRPGPAPARLPESEVVVIDRRMYDHRWEWAQ